MRWQVAAVVALAAWLLAGGHAWAAPVVAISAPSKLVGDGSTVAELTIAFRAGSGARVTELSVVANAGSVGAPRGTGTDVVTFPYTPPRVASGLKVTITARAIVGGKRRKTRQTIAITAPDATSVAVTEAKGPFGLSAPRHMVLGRDTSATIRLRKPAGAMPVLVTSAGSISSLRETAAGVLEATYTPPAAGFPQVAIIVARSPDRDTVGWLAIPLFGVGNVALKSEPYASVVVRVGDTDYGPVRTNGSGRATIAIAAPPGVRVAKTTATDLLGNTKTGKLALTPPPFVRHLVLCPLAGNRARIIVVGTAAVPDTAAQITVKVSVGSLSAMRMATPGLYEATYSAPETASIGDELEIVASVDRKPAARSRCRSKLPGETPTGAHVTFSRAVFRAGSGEIAIRIKPTFPGRLPPLAVALEIKVDSGTVSGTSKQPDGSWSAVWSPSDRLEGRTRLVAAIRLANTGAVLGQATLAAAAATPARLELTASRTRLRADGRARATLSVRVLDAFDNPVPGVELAARGSGRIGRFSSKIPGVYTVIYTSPLAYEPGSDTVVVRHGASSTETSISIALDPSRRQRSIVAKLGYLTNAGKVSAPIVAIEAGTRIPGKLDNVGVGVEVSFYSSSRSQSSADGTDRVTTLVTAVPIQLRATYHLPLERFEIYVGAGGGVLLGSAGTESVTTGKVVERQTGLALSGFVGGEFQLGPGRAAIEIAYLASRVDTETVEGNVGGARTTLGYRYEF